jgi:ethanolamine ammonia-lyase large subunit
VSGQVFDAFSYATGDIVIGTNPRGQPSQRAWLLLKRQSKTSSIPSSCRIRSPGACFPHIDVQAEVSERYPGTVATMFQSLAGTDDCNKTFDVTVEKILK